MRTAVSQVQLRRCYLLYFFQDLKTIEINHFEKDHPQKRKDKGQPVVAKR